MVRSALAIAHPGITLSGFVYTAATTGGTKQAKTVRPTPATLAITGVAKTRDALRNYQLALEDAPFALRADLPVSAYAEETDAPFTITITLAL
jgi:hypothetical protein